MPGDLGFEGVHHGVAIDGTNAAIADSHGTGIEGWRQADGEATDVRSGQV